MQVQSSDPRVYGHGVLAEKHDIFLIHMECMIL